MPENEVWSDHGAVWWPRGTDNAGGLSLQIGDSADDLSLQIGDSAGGLSLQIGESASSLSF